ncbi:MAG: hypothetical protein V3R84_01470 [Acidimicrobiia bacterium]
MASSRSWEDIVEVRERCAEGVERGKQVWAASEYGAYRLALDAPGEFAAAAVVSGAGRHTLGPLWEVAASTHEWAELEPHLDMGDHRELVARERALRGEDVGQVPAHTYDIPVAPEQWEPRYAVAVYRADGADFPEPEVDRYEALEVPAATAEVTEDDDVLDALHDLVEPWTGSVQTVAVRGSTADAIAATGASAVVAKRLEPQDAIARMGWAGASGGAHGRRRGAAVGRYNAWWAVANLAGAEWPDLGGEGSRLEWLAWRPADFTEGWELHLAIADPERGLAWAIAATDVVDT